MMRLLSRRPVVARRLTFNIVTVGVTSLGHRLVLVLCACILLPTTLSPQYNERIVWRLSLSAATSNPSD